ncbi:MAG: hypothetical protein WA982_04670 [Rubrobacteraceae bacterium]
MRCYLKVRGREPGIATKSYFFHHYVGHLKAGRLKEPSFGKIYAISRAMGVPLDEWVRTAGDRYT